MGEVSDMHSTFGGVEAYADRETVAVLQLLDVGLVDAMIGKFVNVYMEALELLLVLLSAGDRGRHLAGGSCMKGNE